MQGDGDIVTARVIPEAPGKLEIASIEGDNGRLSLDPAKNCIGIAAAETLKMMGQPSCGVSLTLRKVLAACKVTWRHEDAMLSCLGRHLCALTLPSFALCVMPCRHVVLDA